MSKTFGLTNYGRVNYLKNFKSGREMWDDPNRQCRKIIKGRFRSRYDRICATRSLINHSQRFPEISCNSRKQEGSWSYCWIRKLSNPKTFSPFHSQSKYIYFHTTKYVFFFSNILKHLSLHHKCTSNIFNKYIFQNISQCIFSIQQILISKYFEYVVYTYLYITVRKKYLNKDTLA